MGLVPSKKEKIREEISKIKSLKGKALWEYIWEYYKLFIIGLLIILLVGGGSLYNSVANPSPTVALNVGWTYGSQLMEFFDDLGGELTRSVTEPSQNEIIQVFSFAHTGDPQMDAGNQMRFAAMITASDLDVLIATRETIVESAEDGMLMDISSFLPSGTEGLVRAEGARSRSPVFGVSILDSEILESASFFMSDDCPEPFVGVFVNTTRIEMARQAIEALLD